jgi:hypothetical protein
VPFAFSRFSSTLTRDGMNIKTNLPSDMVPFATVHLRGGFGPANYTICPSRVLGFITRKQLTSRAHLVTFSRPWPLPKSSRCTRPHSSGGDMIHTLSRWQALPTRPTSHEASSCRMCLASAAAVLYPLPGGTWFGNVQGLRAQRREPTTSVAQSTHRSSLPIPMDQLRPPSWRLPGNYFPCFVLCLL